MGRRDVHRANATESRLRGCRYQKNCVCGSQRFCRAVLHSCCMSHRSHPWARGSRPTSPHQCHTHSVARLCIPAELCMWPSKVSTRRCSLTLHVPPSRAAASRPCPVAQGALKICGVNANGCKVIVVSAAMLQILGRQCCQCGSGQHLPRGVSIIVD